MKPATGSRTGTGTWLVQRATAVALALVVPALALYVIATPPTDFANWQARFSPLWLRVSLLLATVALALHAWVGMRDIFMDYVHATVLRLALYLAVIATLIASVTWLAALLFATPAGGA